MPAAHGTKERVKRVADDFLSKLYDSFDVQKSNGSSQLPPHQGLPYESKVSVTSGSGQSDLITTFNDLGINDKPRPTTASSNAHFVGGFNPGYPSIPNAYSPSTVDGVGSSMYTSNLPRPMAMPSPYSEHPHSLTMQMALQPVQEIPYITARPHSNPVLSSSIQAGSTSSSPASGRPSLPPSKSSTSSSPASAKPSLPPSRPTSTMSEVSSAVTTPSETPDPEQCAGVTKAGKRCTRKVKTGPALLSPDIDDAPGQSTSLPRFCHQHTKELLGPSGYYARKNGEWVTFEDWIPPYLQQATQVSLRVEMEKARSQSDVHGYIYTFEIRETSEAETVKLKVGRAVNLVKRIDQWGKQCGSKEQVLRGFYPGTVEPDEDGGSGSLMKGRVKAGEKGPWCHRLERLIHLELADLASTQIYLNPSWPKLGPSASEMPPGGDGAKASSSKDSNTLMQPCLDCGSTHKEIFEFTRWKKGRNRGKEWQNLVKPVVERWGKFVELYV